MQEAFLFLDKAVIGIPCQINDHYHRISRTGGSPERLVFNQPLPLLKHLQPFGFRNVSEYGLNYVNSVRIHQPFHNYIDPDLRAVYPPAFPYIIHSS